VTVGGDGGAAGRIDAELRRAAQSDLSMLAITTAPRADSNAWGEAQHFADQCGLTVYDAADLELAPRSRPARDA
jgi:hypothetical protein